jgi:hypothetical protein
LQNPLNALFEVPVKATDSEILKVLEVGGEGGSITLEGRKVGGAWQFRVRTSDESLLLLGEEKEGVVSETGWVDTWRGAMKLMDRHPWHQLSPIAGHPAFLKRICDALTRRLARDEAERFVAALRRQATL